MIYGRQPLRSGAFELDGKPHAFRSVRDAKAAGLALIPADRHGEAMLSGLTVRENIALPIFDRFITDPILRIMRELRERRHAEQIASTLSIRTPSVETSIDNLSGGNQQKAILARWLAESDVRVVILDEPTRGIDIGAKHEIYNVIYELAERGCAIVVVSSELPEVLGIADRVVVMREGRIAGELDRERATEQSVLSLALPDIPH